MNQNPQIQKPKIDNNALFAQRLKDTPPEYNIGELVKYVSKKKTNGGVGYISGRTFNENEKVWKYTIRLFGINVHIDDITVLEKV